MIVGGRGSFIVYIYISLDIQLYDNDYDIEVDLLQWLSRCQVSLKFQ